MDQDISRPILISCPTDNDLLASGAGPLSIAMFLLWIHRNSSKCYLAQVTPFGNLRTVTSDSRTRAQIRRPFPFGQNAAQTIIHQPGIHFPREVPSKLGIQSLNHTSQRTPPANAPSSGNRNAPTNQPEAGLFGRQDHRTAAEYRLDTLTLSVSILSVSRPL
jgi:hypothetical protein